MISVVAGPVMWIVFLGGAALAAQSGDQAIKSPASEIPEEFSGWKAVEDRVYDPDTIFSYIDGAGEVYRSYNFRSLFARRYEAPGRPGLVVDLFDMGSGADAFGMFTHDLDGEPLDIGQGAVYKGGLLSFWKGRYFVSIYAEEETSEGRQSVLSAGKKIAGLIPGEAPKPGLLDLLPEPGLDRASIRYFHTHFILNYHFFVSTENILRLEAATDAVLAPYGGKGGRNHLLIVRYPDDSAAREALKDFSAAYLPDAREPGIIRTEDGKWTACRRWERIVAVNFGAADRTEALERLEAVGGRIEIHNDRRR